jgi:hypothetical protein
MNEKTYGIIEETVNKFFTRHASRTFWVEIRKGILIILNTIEKEFRIYPTTSELRKDWKNDLFRQDIESINRS